MNTTASLRPAPVAVAIASLLAACGSSNGAVNCWLDFTNFQTRLTELVNKPEVQASDGGNGFADFSMAERNTLMTTVRNVMAAPYAGVPGITANFTNGPRPGPNAATDEVFFFGQSYGGPGGAPYGDADRIDWRNPSKNDTGRIYTNEFELVLAAINNQAGVSRADKITQLGTALGQTAAHEFGHNIGLKHRDCYGTVYQGQYANTGGVQKQFIMSSGTSGLGDNLDRAAVRTFNWLGRTKMAFADGLANAPLTTMGDGAGNTDFNNATPLVFQTAPTSGRLACDVVGTLAANEDWFSFTATAGDTVVADIFSNDITLGGRLTNPINAALALYFLDESGMVPVTQFLFSSDDFKFRGNTVYGGTNPESSLDPFILNATLSQTGTYFLEVDLSTAGGMNYELFVSIPAPGSALLVLSAGALLARRRRTA